MTSLLKLRISKHLQDNCRKAVNYYIRERNLSENREPYAMFSSTYRSNIAAYFSFIESDDRHTVSLLQCYERKDDHSTINIASPDSVEQFVEECIEISGAAGSTTGACIAAIQKWIDVIELKENHFG